MLFHDAIRKLENRDLSVLESYLEGSKICNYKEENGKKVAENKVDFANRLINLFLFALKKTEKDKGWNFVHGVIAKLPDECIEVLIAFIYGSIDNPGEETKKEFIGNLITYIKDVKNERLEKNESKKLKEVKV